MSVGTSEHGGPRSASGQQAVLDSAAVRAIVFGIMLAMFLSALEQTIVAPALPTIGRSLGDIENLSWVVTAYLLSTTVATPLFGKLSDIYGRRALMLVSVGVFILGSIACALAPTLWMLVLARALQGIGGGGILPLAQTVIADLLSPRERPTVQSYSSVMFMSASILGPVLGGLLTDYIHWSLIFWINVPLGAAALLMTDRALRRLPRHERPHRLDLLGATVMVGAAVALLLALSWGGGRYPWASVPIAALFCVSVVLWGVFALRLISAPEPFIPLALVREPVVGAVVAAGFFGVGTIIGLSIYIPLYVELVLRQSASASGLILIAFMGGATAGLDAGRPTVVAPRPLQAGAARRPADRHCGACRVRNLAGPVFRDGSRGPACIERIGPRASDVSDHHGHHPERGRAVHQLGTATGTLAFFSPAARRRRGGCRLQLDRAHRHRCRGAGNNHAGPAFRRRGGGFCNAVSLGLLRRRSRFCLPHSSPCSVIEERPLRGPADRKQLWCRADHSGGSRAESGATYLPSACSPLKSGRRARLSPCRFRQT